MNEILDSKEAARYLKLSEKFGYKTIQKWAREGRIKAGRVGDMWRFRPEDLDAFMVLNGNSK